MSVSELAPNTIHDSFSATTDKGIMRWYRNSSLPRMVLRYKRPPLSRNHEQFGKRRSYNIQFKREIIKPQTRSDIRSVPIRHAFVLFLPCRKPENFHLDTEYACQVTKPIGRKLRDQHRTALWHGCSIPNQIDCLIHP